MQQHQLGCGIAFIAVDTKVSAALTNESGGTLAVQVDNALLLTELHLGAFVRGRLGERVTTYAAVGPMVMYGSLDANNDNGSQSSDANLDNANANSNSSDINLGYYARAGIDFAIDDKQSLGLGIRYLSTELDFDQSVGKVDIKGPQYVLTLTFQL